MKIVIPSSIRSFNHLSISLSAHSFTTIGFNLPTPGDIQHILTNEPITLAQLKEQIEIKYND